MSFLELKAVNTFRGSVQVLRSFSLQIEKGEAVGLIGRNGAGKTTVMESIIGIAPAYNGSITFKDRQLVVEELNPEKTTKIISSTAKLGIGFVPEDRRIFPNLTVKENLQIGIKKNPDLKSGWTMESILEMFPKLKKMLTRSGFHLSGGEKQMLTIARTLLGNPEVLLLDEPSEGLAPIIVSDIKAQLIELKKQGLAMLISEQNHSFLDGICDRIYLIELGTNVFSGKMGEYIQASKEGRFDAIGVGDFLEVGIDDFEKIESPSEHV